MRKRWSALFSSVLTTSVAMETWPVERSVFVYDAFVKRRAVPPRSPDLSTCDFFPFWVFEIACLRSQTPYVERFEGSHPSGNSSDRSSVVGRCHGRLKKMLENCIQEGGRHLTDIIFKTEPSSMACFKL